MEREPQRPPSGVWIQERLDGFLLSVSTRAPWFALLYWSVWVFIWVSVIGGVTPKLLAAHAIGANVMITVLWMAVAVNVFGWLVMVYGRYVLKVEGDRATLVLWVWPFRWRRRFAWSGVTGVSWQRSSRKGAPPWIVLSGARRLRFGSIIRTDRRNYVYRLLQEQLARRFGESGEIAR